MNEYNEDFRFEEGVLHVRLSGTFPNVLLSSEKNLFQPLIDTCKAHNCKKALIDARDLQVSFDTLAKFRAGEDAAFLARFGLRIAILAREDMLDPFFEQVVSNRGNNVGLFIDIDTAREWLRRY